MWSENPRITGQSYGTLLQCYVSPKMDREEGAIEWLVPPTYPLLAFWGYQIECIKENLRIWKNLETGSKKKAPVWNVTAQDYNLL
ncbi:hypothetical protein J6590_013958 [Homalodisca vitripennis]|nr:hypothetical protein J6590_013958 [Homalodisca vitripennis]